MWLLVSLLGGVAVYFAARVLYDGFYIVKPDERAVLTSFGRAQRLGDAPVDDPELGPEEKERYRYPRVRVVRPGGPYLKWPWQEVHKVSVATRPVDLTWDPTKDQETVEAVTKDNLTTGLSGQIRYRVDENNLYAYFFGVQSPLEHVMGYFISVLRERIATFDDPQGGGLFGGEQQASGSDEARDDDESDPMTEGVSINALRKNLPLLNDYMEEQCRCTAGRYGIALDAALVSTIDPPEQVDRALAAINSTRNQVAADLSTASADADQQITMSKRAVDIARNEAEAEVAPVKELAGSLRRIKEEGGRPALRTYLRNMRIPLLERAASLVEVERPGLEDGGKEAK